MILACVGAALANGQTTHVWITRHALEHLPEGHELTEIVQDPAHEDMLINGAMFPDGGYAVGHPYGEAGHWEPLQAAYLQWIREEQGFPLTDSGREHVAFLMGLASHGMADQTFDALYMERSKVYDADYGWADGDSMDEATDVIWAQLTGPQPIPELWFPGSALEPLFLEQEIEVSTDTMEDGLTLLHAAMELVGWMSEQDDVVAGYEAEFPWASAHLHDAEDVPGAPRCEGEIVALYWLDLWERLENGFEGDNAVLATLPVDGGWGHERDHGMVEARVSLVFARGLVQDSISAEDFVVTGPDGSDLPVDTWLFYRDDSHVLHLIPQADWPLGEISVEVLGEGIEDRYGNRAASGSWSFSTEPRPSSSPDGGCSTLPLVGIWWLGALSLVRRRGVRR